MSKKERRMTLDELKEHLNSPDLMFGIISRSELAKRSGGLFNRKTLANWDSDGKGFKQKLAHEDGKQTAYFVADVLEYIRDKYRIVTKAK